MPRIAAASTALATLNSPGSGIRAGALTPSGPCRVNVCSPCGVASRSVAFHAASVPGSVVTVTVCGVSSAWPHALSTTTTSVVERPSNSSDFAAKYSCMSLWKSRWSWERLVNAPTANRVPLARPSASAWLETSIGTCVTPRSSITASSACRSGASGVVNPLTSRSPAIRVSTVPIRPVVSPAACRPASTR